MTAVMLKSFLYEFIMTKMKKRHFFLRFFLIFFMCFCVLNLSHAQSYLSFSSEREQILENTRLKIGPFRIFPRLQLRNIGYDDNVYYQRQEDEPVSDYTGTFSPEIKVHLLFRDYLILTLTENPEYVYYAEEKAERRWNNSLSPEFRLLLLHRFIMGGKYILQSRRYRPSREFDLRIDQTQEGYEGSLFYETARKTSIGVTLTKATISFEDIVLPGQEIYLSRALDRKEASGQMEFYYRIFSESFFFVTWGYTEYSFSHGEAEWRNSHSYQGYLGLRFPLMGKARGTLSLGYKKLVPEWESSREFSGLAGKTNLEFRMGRFGLRLKYERDSHFSYWAENIYFISDTAGGGLSFYLTRFLRLDYNIEYGESHYPEKMPLRMPDGSEEMMLRKDIYRTHTAGFVVRVFKNVGIGLNVNFWERKSNFFSENRDRMFIGGYLTYDF